VQGDGNVLPCEVFKDPRRRTWHLNANRQSLKEILASQNLGELRRRLEARACLACPIHRALRRQQRAEGENERVPGSAVYAS
jgi:radical SAM protein with 4Fe4S-binding SPASM domain